MGKAVTQEDDAAAARNDRGLDAAAPGGHNFLAIRRSNSMVSQATLP